MSQPYPKPHPRPDLGPLPNDLAAEQAVLGAILLQNDAYYDLPTGFRAEHFYRTEHQVLFRAIASLIDQKKPADSVTVADAIRATAENVDLAYLAGLADLVPSVSATAVYAAQVLDASLRRSLAYAHSQASQLAADETVPVEELRLRTEQLLSEVDEPQKPLRTLRQAAKSFITDLGKRLDGEVPGRAFKIGLDRVDRNVWIHPTDFVVVGGRPGSGKSMFLWQIARRVGMANTVLFVSIEMNETELLQRGIMDEGEVKLSEIRQPRTNESLALIMGAVERVAKADIRISHCSRPIEVLREATRLHRKSGLALLVIDYLQRCNLPQVWGETRDQRIGELTRRLKDFAETNHVPVLAAAQLKRIDHLSKGRDPRPELDDLRESGNIEQDANTVLFLHRPGLIIGTHEAKAVPPDIRTTQLLVPKQRSGESGFSLPLICHPEFARFREPVEDANDQGPLPFEGGQGPYAGDAA